MNKQSSDSEDFLNDLLQYHQNLSQQDFTPQLMAKIKRAQQLRVYVLLAFLALAILVCYFLLSKFVPDSFMANFLTQQPILLSSILLCCGLLPSLWLLTVEK